MKGERRAWNIRGSGEEVRNEMKGESQLKRLLLKVSAERVHASHMLETYERPILSQAHSSAQFRAIDSLNAQSGSGIVCGRHASLRFLHVETEGSPFRIEDSVHVCDAGLHTYFQNLRQLATAVTKRELHIDDQEGDSTGLIAMNNKSARRDITAWNYRSMLSDKSALVFVAV
ncbi:hypothetical protein V1478_018819 [Vespula squamosa]|uniref:Uncharacterized protein n=1 Tax=Vespula squamosa TaxID=30214 RepID=A0ABD1ZTV9_VESSQ